MYVARHQPSESRYSDPSPLDALPRTRTLPSPSTLRLPAGFLAIRTPGREQSWEQPWEQRIPDGSNGGSNTLTRPMNVIATSDLVRGTKSECRCTWVNTHEHRQRKEWDSNPRRP